ncbi:catio diffusion facilitator CzcD-associated flavoprotein CzcO [Streptomyces sp. Ag82_O1-15]|uniref:flavin-containing monooxygenase n=1 Tax=Streptomyces sp. Ag82_O1-15 TaxID=1938855 RepID=UPI000BB0DC41|nr:alpha/beta hydrolase fold domain-containing protein [Streptomyces sp. Ag82_O1-15]PBD00369.1 catio diffusion facilitator CzcD-associated flavoprotein CzcO [Streptomyces sp. Ag82_O1-15]
MDETHVDAVIVGAGFSGLYATHRLRNQQGLSVQSFEAASGPGGVWHWNQYPGARCDFESIFYSFSFDEDLQREWRWKERYAAQPEILAYLEHVADRFDLRRSYRFSTRVTSAVWDEAAQRWVVGTDDGGVTIARFFINAAGAFSVNKPNDFPGQETFRGTVVHTSRWPADGVDLAGKRVAVIGTGSTGIQVIQTIAPQVSELTVFQRTANFACPLGNRPLTDEEFEQTVADYPRLREESRNSLAGAAYPRATRPALADSPEERRKTYDTYYNGGGFRMLASTYFDLIYNPGANETAADYIRDRIRERVKDPKTAELLTPKGHPYGAKRATFETKYFETFNLPHVRLVDAKTTPIERITEKGIATTAQEYEFDVIVLATGFDVGAGALMRMGVVGRDGRKLTDHWADGQRAYIGMANHGFPNLFHVNGPQSAAALFNNPIAIEDSVDFIADLIAYTDAHGHRTAEVTAAAEDRYNEVVLEVAEATLFPNAVTWYMGDNIPGKPRRPISLFTGAPMYRAICAEVQATEYAGFSLDGDARDLPNSIKIDGAAVFLLAGLMNMGAKPLEESSLEEIRAGIETFKHLQLPVPSDVGITDTQYPTAGGERTVRLYRPPVEGPLPVVVFFHGGGWVAGSLDLYDEPCASLARRLGALVVSPDYRLAPEHPFPAAIDDTMAALRWAAENIAGYGGDPERIAVGGESAGANLAAVAALRTRDEGGPRLAAQVLVTPPTDFTADTESRKTFARGPIISTELGGRMAAWYLGDPAHVTSSWAAPAHAPDLSNLPPALVVTMEIDPLRDEGEDYARALTEAGVPTVCKRLDGLIHTTFVLSGSIPRAAEIQDAISDFLAPLLSAEARKAKAAATLG